jgi:hypothetical protein
MISWTMEEPEVAIWRHRMTDRKGPLSTTAAPAKRKRERGRSAYPRSISHASHFTGASWKA